mgnify:CR=1 FL=1
MSPEQLDLLEAQVVSLVREFLSPDAKGSELATEVHTFALYLANSSFCAAIEEADDESVVNAQWEE